MRDVLVLPIGEGISDLFGGEYEVLVLVYLLLDHKLQRREELMVRLYFFTRILEVVVGDLPHGLVGVDEICFFGVIGERFYFDYV